MDMHSNAIPHIVSYTRNTYQSEQILFLKHAKLNNDCVC